MDSQIYLLLLRQSGSYKEWDKELKGMNAIKAAIIMKQLLKDIVVGDSLDAPFVKFIRVKSISHKLGFSGDSKFDKSGWAYKNAWKEESGQQYSANPLMRGTTNTVSNSGAFSKDFMPQLGRELWGGNEFIQGKIPEHGEIQFKKYLDSATAELAYGCSAQEKFPLAVFFYRRKVGTGLGGIRLPYFVMGSFKCKIKEWELDGDEETVSLHYKKIAWCSFDQWADTNVSYPWATRWFDQEQVKGGQGEAAMALQMIVAAMVAVSGAVSATLTSGEGASGGSADDLK